MLLGHRQHRDRRRRRGGRCGSPRCRRRRPRTPRSARSWQRSGLLWSSFVMMTILRPSISIVPLVAYSKPMLEAGFGLFGVGLERAGAAVDQRDLQVVRARGERARQPRGRRDREGSEKRLHVSPWRICDGRRPAPELRGEVIHRARAGASRQTVDADDADATAVGSK